MADALKPALPSLGTEIWVNGSLEAVDFITRMLEANGTLLQKGKPEAMTGNDRGRWRVYHRAVLRSS